LTRISSGIVNQVGTYHSNSDHLLTICSSQCRSLTTQYQIFPDLVFRPGSEIRSGTTSTLQIVQGLRSDISELRQTQLTTLHILEPTRSDHRKLPRSAQTRYNTSEFWGSVVPSLNALGLSSENLFHSNIYTDEQMLRVICALPIGKLYYSSGHRKSISTDTDSKVTKVMDEKSTISFKFIPASWVSNVLVRLTLEIYRRRDQTRTLSIRLTDPAQICSDAEVLKSLGLRYDEYSGICRGSSCTMDPIAFRDHLLQGHVGPNDVLYSYKMNGVVSILRGQYASCSIVLNVCLP
jgi:hypothetical protein